MKNLLAVARLWWALFWIAFAGIKDRDLGKMRKERRGRSGAHVKNQIAYDLWEDFDWELQKLVAKFGERAEDRLGAVRLPNRTYAPLPKLDN